jgi:alpha-L-fucosidase
MDQGFGYNRTSAEADHIGHDDLLRSLVDITATGGNLLLNVGARGDDATIPDAQVRRLDWLADFSATTAAGPSRACGRPSASGGQQAGSPSHGQRCSRTT